MANRVTYALFLHYCLIRIKQGLSGVLRLFEFESLLIQDIFTIHFAYKPYHLMRDLTPHIYSSFSGVPRMYPNFSYTSKDRI